MTLGLEVVAYVLAMSGIWLGTWATPHRLDVATYLLVFACWCLLLASNRRARLTGGKEP